MVDEALVASLAQKAQPADGDDWLLAGAAALSAGLQRRLRGRRFALRRKRDGAGDRQLLRGCGCWTLPSGSGAFPMGVLHKLTLALRRLDPDNTALGSACRRDRLAGVRAAGGL